MSELQVWPPAARDMQLLTRLGGGCSRPYQRINHSRPLALPPASSRGDDALLRETGSALGTVVPSPSCPRPLLSPGRNGRGHDSLSLPVVCPSGVNQKLMLVRRSAGAHDSHSAVRLSPAIVCPRARDLQGQPVWNCSPAAGGSQFETLACPDSAANSRHQLAHHLRRVTAMGGGTAPRSARQYKQRASAPLLRCRHHMLPSPAETGRPAQRLFLSLNPELDVDRLNCPSRPPSLLVREPGQPAGLDADCCERSA